MDRQLSRVISYALKRFTSLDTLDYHGILRLSEGYAVDEMEAASGHWVTGRNLVDLRLSEEGIHVLGIHRADASYVGSPAGETFIRSGDTAIMYGR